MQLLAPISPRVIPGRTIDILDVAPEAAHDARICAC